MWNRFVLCAALWGGSSLFSDETQPPAETTGETTAQPVPARQQESPPGPPRDLPGRGLFDLRDPMPLAELHLQLPIDLLEVYKAGDGKIELTASWGNSFILEKSFLVDAETVSVGLGGWYAPLDDLYLGAELPVHYRDGGILDPTIDLVHDAFGFGEGNRDERCRNEYEISITDLDGDRIELDRGAGLGDSTLKVHWNVHPGEKWYPAVAIQGLVSFPTSTKGFGSSGVDLGMTIAFSKRVLDPLCLYAVLGGTYLTDSTTAGLRYERETYQAVAGAEIAITRRLSFIIQTMNFTPLLERPAPLNRKRNYVAGGLKWEYLEGFTVEFSLIENYNPFTSSADLGLAGGFGFRF